MTRLRIIVTNEFFVDPDAYLRDGIEADWFDSADLAEMIADSAALVDMAIGYADPEELLPCWARDCLRAQTVDVTWSEAEEG